MYEKLLIGLRGHAKRHGCDDRCPCYDAEDRGYTTCSEELAEKAADAIEERDRYALTIQHEMMSEAESHIALVERLNKQIEELRKPRWIPVTERLPEKEDEAVIVWEKQGFALIDWRHDNKWVILDNNYGIATHWMPLPEPPKEEAWAKKI